MLSKVGNPEHHKIENPEKHTLLLRFLKIGLPIFILMIVGGVVIGGALRTNLGFCIMGGCFGLGILFGFLSWLKYRAIANSLPSTSDLSHSIGRLPGAHEISNTESSESSKSSTSAVSVNSMENLTNSATVSADLIDSSSAVSSPSSDWKPTPKGKRRFLISFMKFCNDDEKVPKFLQVKGIGGENAKFQCDIDENGDLTDLVKECLIISNAKSLTDTPLQLSNLQVSCHADLKSKLSINMKLNMIERVGEDENGGTLLYLRVLPPE